MEKKLRYKKTKSYMLKEIKIMGKVSYDEYKEYLKDKSADEINALYIELQVNLKRIEKLNTLMGYTCLISLMVGIYSIWQKWIVLFMKEQATGLSWNAFNHISILLLFLAVVIIGCIVTLVNIEANYKRKILIIKELFDKK